MKKKKLRKIIKIQQEVIDDLRLQIKKRGKNV